MRNIILVILASTLILAIIADFQGYMFDFRTIENIGKKHSGLPYFFSRYNLLKISDILLI